MVQDHAIAQQDLLSPSAALNSFKPRKGLILSLKSGEQKRVRYGFRVDSLGFLIDKNTVSEIVEQATIYPVPHAPPWLAGLINLRGNLVTVFDFKLCLGLRNPYEKHYLLVLDKGDDAVCLKIDKLPQLVGDVKKLAHLPPLPPALQGCVSEAYSHDKILWVEFNQRVFFQSLIALACEASASH